MTRTKKHKIEPDTDDDDLDMADLCAPLAARRQPKPRRGQRKKRDLVEYIDFRNAMLQIEVCQSSSVDAFVDSTDSSSGRTSWESDCSDESPSSPSGPPASREGEMLSSASQKAEQSPRTPPQSQRRPSPDPRASPGSPTPVSSQSYDSCHGITDAGRAFRHSIISHARAQFTRQFRVFFFHVLLFGSCARLIRWDRAGGSVSESFDYTSDPQLLSDFFWRLSHMNDEQLGWDTTVKRPNKKETALFKGAVQHFLREMKMASRAGGTFARKLPRAERTLDGSGTYPTWKIHVVNDDTGCSSDLIVNRPFICHPAVSGRATRAYIAYDVQQERLVFFKDSWRDTDHALRPEFQTYHDLHAHDVPNVPQIFYGGDVVSDDGTHATISQTFNVDKDGKRILNGEVARRIHHRIVQDIAYPLETALDEREFVQAIHDALCGECLSKLSHIGTRMLTSIVTALDKAYSAGLLHRDISFKNVMITSAGRGILNDWDHAGTTDDLSTGIVSICCFDHWYACSQKSSRARGSSCLSASSAIRISCTISWTTWNPRSGCYCTASRNASRWATRS